MSEQGHPCLGLRANATYEQIISFAPKTFLLSLLKKVGEFFPGPSKATRAYLHAEVSRAAQMPPSCRPNRFFLAGGCCPHTERLGLDRAQERFHFE
mmetsp:Transcript_1035/g.2389  ORF Transcript_1035/g.2389 Transcript_1035/m.2389 type:complete len:96 (-) Transcript_1035:8-295(-)